MKTKIIFYLAWVVSFCCSCHDNNKDSLADPLSDEQILFNLSENGMNDPKLLIGEWNCVKFAYTADGNNISNAAVLKSNFTLTIPSAPTPIDDAGVAFDKWHLKAKNSLFFVCSLEGNLIELKFQGSTYMNVPPLDEEHDLSFALANAHSFVIKNNELLIHFHKVEDENILSHCTVIKNKNLLILKKQ